MSENFISCFCCSLIDWKAKGSYFYIKVKSEKIKIEKIFHPIDCEKISVILCDLSKNKNFDLEIEILGKISCFKLLANF